MAKDDHDCIKFPHDKPVPTRVSEEKIYNYKCDNVGYNYDNNANMNYNDDNVYIDTMLVVGP